MDYFDEVLDNVHTVQIIKKFQNFDIFYYNIKHMMKSKEFKDNGRMSMDNNRNEYIFNRIITKGSNKIYINSGYLCTTIAINNKEYYNAIQCSHIVKRDRDEHTYVDSSYRECITPSSKKSSRDDSSSYFNSPSNPSNFLD